MIRYSFYPFAQFFLFFFFVVAWEGGREGKGREGGSVQVKTAAMLDMYADMTGSISDSCVKNGKV